MRIVRISALLVLGQFLIAEGATAQVRITLVKPEIVEARLNRVTSKARERLSTLETLFAEAGCPRERQEEQWVPATSVPNVICSLPGSGDDVVVIGAHYDFSADFGRGVIDNWTGAAMLPSLYEALRAAGPHRLTYIFVEFTGEERGLFGSRHFVKTLSPAARKSIRAMVNLDCLGLTTTKVEFKPKHEQLAKWLHGVAVQLNVPLDGVDVSRVGSSDHDSFRSAGIPAIAIHSLTPETYRTVHSTRDRIDAVRLADYYDTYKLTAVYLAALDTAFAKSE